MKFFVLVALFVLCASCTAEPPRFGSARQRSKFFARQEAAPELTTPATDDAPYPAAEAPYPAAAAPYPASGWKPSGQAFELPTTPPPAPATDYGTPDNSYGVPDNTYGPPADVYGAPPSDSTDVVGLSGSDVEVTEPPMTTGRLRLQKSQRLVQGVPERSFYILLPDNTLQKIDVRPTGARVNSKFNAKILQAVPGSRNRAFF